MEENKPSFFNSTLNWGAIIGTFLIIYNLIFYFFGINLEKWVPWLSYLLVFIGIIFSSNNYRKNSLNGTMNYGQALGFSTIVVVFASIIYSVYYFVLLQFIDNSLIDKMLEMAEEEYIKYGMPEDMIESSIEMARKFMKPWLIALMTLLTYSFIGFILALVASIFTQKKQTKIPFES